MTGRQQARAELSRTEVAAQLRVLGVEEGGVLLVHTSLRVIRCSARPVVPAIP